jgi:hypothetical protein
MQMILYSCFIADIWCTPLTLSNLQPQAATGMRPWVLSNTDMIDSPPLFVLYRSHTPIGFLRVPDHYIYHSVVYSAIHSVFL